MDGSALADLEPYQWQAAGHQVSKTSEKRFIGLLRDKKRRLLLKPVQQPPRGECELKFYEMMWNDDSDLMESLLPLRKWLPRFYGLREVTQNGTTTRYIQLEDATATMLKPCVVDIKIGARTWDPEATEEKIQMERSKYPYGLRVCFRVLGMMIYQPEQAAYLIHNKTWGKALTEEGIPNCFAEYFDSAGSYRSIVIDMMLEKLRSIESFFSTPFGYAFYSSSLLLAYDGVIDDQHPPHVDVRMIDFAHVFGHQGCDSNYLDGVRSVIRFIEMQKKTESSH